MTDQTTLDKQRRLLLTEAGDTHPLDPAYVKELTEIVALCVEREKFGDLPKIDARDRLASLSLDEFLRTAIRHRVVSLLARHTTLPSDWVERFTRQQRRIAIAAMQNLRHVDYLDKEFTTRGLPHVFMKGCGVSLVAVGRLGLRDAPTDVDILISEQDTIEAHNLLVALGYEAQSGATPDKPKIWQKMLFAYPELAYSKESVTVDLHWRPAHHQDLFPPSEALIAGATQVSLGDIAFPTLNTTHALWLEAVKMLQDRNFSLSNPVTIAHLAKNPGTPTSTHLTAVVSSAQAFTTRLLRSDSASPNTSPLTKREKTLQDLHSQNWDLFATMGMKFTSHRTWAALPPREELFSRLKTLLLTGGTVKALQTLGTQLFFRPYERFGFASHRDALHNISDLARRARPIPNRKKSATNKERSACAKQDWGISLVGKTKFSKHAKITHHNLVREIESKPNLENPPSSRKFAVVIVHYNQPESTLELLQSMVDWEEKPARVILADNSAPLHSWEEALELPLPLQVLLFPDNPGYGAAIKRSVATLGDETSFVLFLTHEVQISGTVVSGLLDSFFEEDRTAISAPYLGYKSQPSLYWSKGGILGPRGETSHLGMKEPIETCPGTGWKSHSVDWVDGSCFLMRLDFFNSLGGFDEKFFLYLEDVELCLRVRLHGGKILVSGGLIAYQEPGNFSSFLKYRNHILFTTKHRNTLRPWPWFRILVRDTVRWVLGRYKLDAAEAVRGVFSAKHKN